MAVLITAILLIGLLLVATESINKMNKAAVAMLMGVLCWLSYIIGGKDFVMAEHSAEFLTFLSDNPPVATSVKEFIARFVFMPYLLRSAEIALFLLATMSIVEVLGNNGCFDFLPEWLRMRSARRYMWLLAGLTFLLSANLDNLTTTCMMLAVMHTMVSDEKLRMTYGSVIVLAANCGGAFTVIGDVSSLVLWVEGLVTPTRYASMLFLPCLAALVTVLALLSSKLPTRLPLAHTVPPYRGDDTVFTRNQRLLMLFVGIGGLWFIPTFHRLTLLPPFVGALCVLSFIWFINELCNRSLLSSDRMVRKRQPIALQYANIQHILYFIGMTLAFGAISETGVLTLLWDWGAGFLTRIHVQGIVLGLLSAVFNNLSVLLGNIATYSAPVPFVAAAPEMLTEDGMLWPLLSYTSALGGTLLPIGTLAGYSLMRMEGVTLRWYLRRMTPYVLAGWAVGLGVFFLSDFLFSQA